MVNNFKIPFLLFLLLVSIFVPISATLSNQAGTIAISKHGEYALLNKETNKEVNILIRALEEESQKLEDRNQPSKGHYLETHRRLRRSLTAEEQAKLMTYVLLTFSHFLSR